MNIAERLKRLISQRHVLKSLVVKNLKEKYVGSSLGIFWAIINPVLLMLVVTFVFTKVMRTGVKDFPLLMLSAALPWFFFTASVTEATVSMRSNMDVLNQFVITREIIPVSVVLANFLNFLFGFLVIMPVFIIFNPAIARYLLLLPLALVLHFVFTLGISLSFSIINVYFKDLSQMLNIGLMFLFWVTPVFYSLEMIPEGYRGIIMANPLTSYAVIYRSLLYYGSFGGGHAWLIAAGFSLASIMSGYVLFVKKESEILKYA